MIKHIKGQARIIMFVSDNGVNLTICDAGEPIVTLNMSPYDAATFSAAMKEVVKGMPSQQEHGGEHVSSLQ